MNATVYKRPESVLVLVYTQAQEFLLMQRVRPASFWQSVTGAMAWDETDPEITAYRELAEETGISASAGSIINCHTSQQFPIKAAWRHRYPPDVKFNTEHVFRLKLPERLPIVLNPAEHIEYLWLSREQALAKVTSYTNRDAILALT